MKKDFYPLVFFVVFILFRLLVLFTMPTEVGFCESFRATTAYDYLTERQFSIFDYTFRHNEGGSLAISMIIALFFKIFGVSLFSMHLAALAFTLSAFIIGYFLVNKFYGKEVAHIFGLLYLFVPQTYLSLSLVTWGNHVESILFIFLAAICLVNIVTTDDYPSNGKLIWSGLLGFTCGFGIWFGYINLILLLTCTLFLVFKQKNFFFSRLVIIFIISFVCGILPLIIYNNYCAFGGIGIVLYKPLYAHFAINIKNIFIKLITFLLYDLPMSFSYSSSWGIPRVLLTYPVYFIWVIIFFLFRLEKRKGMTAHKNKQVLADFFILLYLIIYVVAYISGDFSVEHSNLEQGKGYRYAMVLFPLFFVLIAEAFAFLKSKMKVLTCLFSLSVIFNFIGTTKLIDLNNFSKSTQSSPLAYSSFGWSIGNKFGKNIKKCISYSLKIKPYARYAYFWGLGNATAEMFMHGQTSYNPEFRLIPEKYKLSFYCAIGAVIGERLPQDLPKAIGILNSVDTENIKQVYTGFGIAAGYAHPQDIQRIIPFIKKDLLCSFYEGVGYGLAPRSDFHPKTYIQNLSDLQIPSDYKFSCFKGLSYMFIEADLDTVKRCFDFINELLNIVDDRYHDTLMQGLKEKEIYFAEILRRNEHN